MEVVSETPEVDEERKTPEVDEKTLIKRFHEIRDTAEKGQSKAADGMVCRGKHLFRALIVGQCATPRVLYVAHPIPKNLLVVMFLNEHDGLYTVGDAKEF
jgi:hypothetical protein